MIRYIHHPTIFFTQREINRRKRFAATPAADPNRALNPVAREPCRGQGRRDGMWSSTLYRRLMMAVTPWAGSRVQAWALQVKAEASRKSKGTSCKLTAFRQVPHPWL